MALIRDIQKETGGFTEFVPLNFIAEEAPMYLHRTHPRIRDGAGGADVLLTHAISRIMLYNIDNVQMSWVKEGSRMSQLLLMWGANDFGGTLINESISTAAGARHGQLIRPAQIRRMVREIGRVPAERTTTYGIIRKFDRGGDGRPARHGGSRRVRLVRGADQDRQVQVCQPQGRRRTPAYNIRLDSRYAAYPATSPTPTFLPSLPDRSPANSARLNEIIIT